MDELIQTEHTLQKYKIIIFIAILLIYLATANNHIGTFGDDARYLILSKSVAETQEYRDLSQIDSPEYIKYPPLYSILLTPLTFIPTHTIYLMELLTGLILFVAHIILYLLLKQIRSRYPMLITIISAINPATLLFAHSIMSEALFILLTYITLYLIEKISNTEEYTKLKLTLQAILAGIILGLTLLTRTIGLSITIALIGYLIISKIQLKKNNKANRTNTNNFNERTENASTTENQKLKNKLHHTKITFAILIIILISILVVSPWLLRNSEIENNDNYVDEFLRKLPESNTDKVLYLTTNIAKTTLFYTGPVLKEDITKLTGKNYNWIGYALIPIGLIIWIIILMDLTDKINYKVRLTHIFLIVYLGTIIFWQFQSTRFLVPIIPFLLAHFTRATKKLGTVFFDSEYIKTTIKAILLIIIIVSTMFAGYTIYKEQTNPYNKNWENYIEASKYLAEQPAGIVFARKCPTTYIFSGQKCVYQNPNINSENIQETITENKVKYILLDNFAWSDRENITETIANKYKPLKEFNGTTIYIVE